MGDFWVDCLPLKAVSNDRICECVSQDSQHAEFSHFSSSLATHLLIMIWSWMSPKKEESAPIICFNEPAVCNPRGWNAMLGRAEA